MDNDVDDDDDDDDDGGDEENDVDEDDEITPNTNHIRRLTINYSLRC